MTLHGSETPQSHYCLQLLVETLKKVCMHRTRNLQLSRKKEKENFHQQWEPHSLNELGLPPPLGASPSRLTEGQNQTCW